MPGYFHVAFHCASSQLQRITCSGISVFALLAIGVSMAMISFATSRDVSPSFHSPSSEEPNRVAPNNAPLMVKLKLEKKHSK